MRTNIFGNPYNDWFAATETIRESFYGLDGDDIFNFYNGTSTFFFGDFTDRFIGGNGNDVMQNLVADWNDYDLYAGLSFDGGLGYDTVSYDLTGTLSSATPGVAFAEAVDLGLFETLEQNVEHHEFDLSLKVSEGGVGTVDITGTSGDETVRLDLTRNRTEEVFPDVQISVDLGAGNDRFDFVGEQTIKSELTIRTGKGNDIVYMNASTTVSSDVSRSKILTGSGKDIVVLEGMHKEIVKSGGGADQIYVLSGNFSAKPDVIDTGGGLDEIFLELDEYSQLAKIKNFDPAKDTIVFDIQETRDTSVTFDEVAWQNSTTPQLYMDNATGTLYFGTNVMATFDGGVTLTADNFETGTWLI